MSYFDLPKFDLPDLAALGSQFGEAIAKAGADIEKAADDALGTSKKVQKEGKFASDSL